MKKGLLILFGLALLVLKIPTGSAQPTLDFAKDIGSTTNDVGTSIAVDASGNIFTTGNFTGTNVEFNPGGTSKLLSASGGTNSDFYIAKYGSTGTIVDAFRVGNTNIDVANKIYVDASGNIYVVGAIIGNAIFDKGGTFTAFQNGSSGKGFVVKYDNTLAVQWSIGLGQTALANGAEVKDIAVDASGNVYITGQFQSSAPVNFNPGASGPGATAGPYTAINLSSNGSTDMFTAVYNSGGVCQWAISAGGTSGDLGLGVDYDNAGNVYVTGDFRGQNIDFDPSAATFNLSEYGGGSTGDIFVAKYSSTGSFVNAFNIGNALYEQSNSIAVDKTSGDFAIAGYFSKDANPIDFDPGPGTANEAGVGTSGTDMFVSKYSTALLYQWHQAVGSPGNESANQVRLSSSNLYVTGSYQGTATDFGSSHPLTAVGGLDVFMAGYAFSNGVCLFASSLGGASDEEGLGIAYVSNKLYVTGDNSGSGDYDPGAGTTTLTNLGGQDIFFGRYSYVSCTLPSITTQPASLNVCTGASVTFNVAATGGPFTYQWKVGGVNASGTSTASSYSIASVVAGNAGNYTVDVTNSCGTITSTPAAVLTVTAPVSATASSTSNVCVTSPVVTLVGSNPSPGTGLWTVSGGTATFVNASNASTMATVTSGTSLTFTWTITSGPCVTSASSATTVNSPVTSNAGSAQTLCNATTATLAGSSPFPGIGTWTVSSGTGVVTTPSSATSGVTGLTVGASSVFTWTVSNGACSAASNVTITSSSPVTSNAGSNQSLCNATTGTLAATGTGTWTVSSGTGVVTTPSSATSGVTGLTVGASSVFTWTVSNGACSAASNVTITSSSPVTSNAGSNQTLCNVTTATLAATGTGTWTVSSGTGVVTTPSSATSGVTGLTVGASSVFTWTVSNGACSAASNVTITSSSPVTSNAGSNQSLCNGTTGTLAATGTGTWTTTSGTGVVTTPSSATSGVTGLTVGASSVFTWTVSNGACSAASNVTITSFSPVTSNAGSNQSLCNTTTATLAATGTGTWTVSSGTGVMTIPSSATSGVTGLTVGASSVFTWTVSNGACSAASNVTITSSSPVTSNAGSNQSLCNATTGMLAATGIGTWTTTSGTGVVTTPLSATSGVTGLTVGASSVFTWTVSNGACSAASNVTITSSSPVTSNAGSNQTLCNTTTATLAATGTGTWTVSSGTGVVTTPSSATSGVTGLTVGASSVFTWTVSNGACSAASNVTITSLSPVTSNAGSNQTLCNVTTATLAATGTGTWTVSSGTGVVTPSSATSGVTGLTVGASSVFTWTVSNGACSAASNVSITSSSPVTSNAGSNQTLCNVTTATLAATGTGTWTVSSGTGVVTTPSSATSGVTGLTVGASSVFTWTVSNGACSAASNVTITSSSPVTSNAGSDQALCNVTATTLAATGTGTWTVVSGTGVLTTPSSASSGVTGLTIGASSTFRWTVTNGACSDFSNMIVSVSSPGSANAGSDQMLCNVTTTTLAAAGTGTWTTTSGTGVVTNPTNANSGVTGLTVGQSTVFKWTVSIGACSGTAQVTVTVSAPAVGSAGVNQTICNATTATLAATGTGTWSTTSGTGIVTNPTSVSSGVTGLIIGAASVFQWTVTNGACSSTSSTTISSYAPVVITTQPAASTTLCASNTFNLNVAATGSGVLSYQWKNGSSNANGTSTNSSYSIPSVVFGDAGNYTVEVTNTCGTLISNVAQLIIQNLAITTQPSSQTVCPGASVTFTVAASGASLSYQWRKNNVDILGQTLSSLNLTSVSASDAADYAVLVSGCSTSVLSNAATLGLSVCTGTVDETNSTNFNLYPNPASGNVHLSGFAQDPINNIMIIDVNGAVVYQQKDMNASSYDFSVKSMTEGLYHVILFTASGSKWIEKIEVAK